MARPLDGVGEHGGQRNRFANRGFDHLTKLRGMRRRQEYPLLALRRANADAFAPLRAHFHAYQRLIHLYVCGMPGDAAGTKEGGSGAGYLFMKELALQTGATIRSNLDGVLNLRDRFQSPSLLVYPEGGFTVL